MNPSGETVINLISPNVSDDSIIDLTSPPMFVSPFRTSKITSAGHNSASSSDTSIRLVDSSFDAVVKEANNSKTIFLAPLPSNAHLNDDLSVSNMLDGVNMSHLGPVFERENVLFFSVIFFIILTILIMFLFVIQQIDINIFVMLTASDLQAMGIVGDDQTAVMSAINSFTE